MKPWQDRETIKKPWAADQEAGVDRRVRKVEVMKGTSIGTRREYDP
jgi:hypothetical protein